MKVRELMSSPVRACRPQDSLDNAARLLWEHDCGILPVLDGDGRVGALITDRDICMGAYTQGKRLADLRVADAMSHSVVTCRAEDEVAEVARRMAEKQLRRLPVVDANGKPCGILALNDLARATEKDPGLGRDALQVLVAASRHRSGVPAAATPLAVAPATRPKASAAGKI